jgi:hypothetical protein
VPRRRIRQRRLPRAPPALWVVGLDEPYRALLTLEAERRERIAELRESEARRDAERLRDEEARCAERDLALVRLDEKRRER